MDEKRIQQVLTIEKEAREIYDSAIREAEQLPLTAEKEAQALVEKSRVEAEKQARELVAKAQAEDEITRILAAAEEKAGRTKGLATGHLERAVGYVLDHVAGRG